MKRLSEERKKSAKIVHSGFDRNLFTEKYATFFRDILVQLCRNSLVHGIENPEEREGKGKSREVTIESRLDCRDETLTLEFQDDGRGLDLDKIRKKALESKNWSPEEVASWDDSRTAQLIFESGFSTAENTDMDAGRGVGMDIVYEKIKESSGNLEIDFSVDKYTKFTIQLPQERP